MSGNFEETSINLGSSPAFNKLLKDKKIQTNHPLIEFPNRKNQFFSFHLPCYVRLNLKNFVSLSLQDLQGSMNANLMIDIDVTHLPEKIKEYLKSNIVVRFNEDSPLILNSENPEIQRKTRLKNNHELIGFRIRKQISGKIIPQIFFTPYEKLFLIYSVNIGHIEIEEDENSKLMIEELNEFIWNHKILNNPNQKKFEIRFNMMDYKLQEFEYFDKHQMETKKMMSRIIFSNDTSFGHYDLAERLLHVQYSFDDDSKKIQEEEDKNNKRSIFHTMYNVRNQRKLTVQEEKTKNELLEKYRMKRQNKIHAWNNAHFEIPIYRRPASSLITIFIPLWLLGVLTLGIFFQEPDLGARIASLATIMMAYVAFLPSIRAELPPSPNVTFVDIMIYLQIFMTFFCFMESMRIQGSSEPFDWKTNGYFYICLIIQILQAGLIIGSAICYYCFFLPSYNVSKGLQLYMNLHDWENLKCNEHYEKMANNYEYRIFKMEKIVQI